MQTYEITEVSYMFRSRVIEFASGTHNGRRGRHVDTSLGVATVCFVSENVKQNSCFTGLRE